MKNNNGVGWIGTSTRTVMVRTQCKPLKQAGLGHRHKLRISTRCAACTNIHAHKIAETCK